MKWDEFIEYARLQNVEVVLLDLGRDLEEQGPFDTIIYKMDEELANTEISGQWLANIENYIRRHPHVKEIDPIDKQKQLMDRGIISHLLDHLNGAKDLKVRCPHFVIINEEAESYEELINAAGVKFPTIYKPLQACGSTDSHLLGIVFSEKRLHEFKPPMLVQEYFNHDGVIFKVFMIGEHLHVVQRPSLPNLVTDFDENTPNITFDSQIPLDSQVTCHVSPAVSSAPKQIISEPSKESLQAIAQSIRESLGLSLAGFDVITRAGTDEQAIIDVNYFPGFRGVKDFNKILLELLLSGTKPSLI